MKKVFLLSTAILFPTIGLADSGLCKAIYRNAEITMDQRQNGVPITFQIDVIDKLNPGSKNDPLKNILYEMVVEAYEHPLYKTESLKLETKQEFAAKWHIRCMSAFRGS